MSLFSTLRARLLLLVCLATLPAVLFTFFVAEDERSAALSRAEQDALHLARLASREHSNQIDGARELLRWLGDRLAREGDRSPIITEPDFLPALLAGYPHLANIGVLTPDGHVLASAHPQARFPNMRDNPAVAAALETREVATGTYIVGPIVHRPVVNLAYAVRDRAGEVQMIVFDSVGLERLTALAARVPGPPGAVVVITDRNDRVLGHVGPDRLHVPAAGDHRIPGVASLSGSQHGRVLRANGGSAARFFVAAPLASGSDLFVAVGVPHQQVLRQANQAFYRTLAAFVLLTVFTIVAVFVSTELAVLRRLRSLVKTVRRFGRGDLAARATAAGGGSELAALARAFNEMATSLAARQREAIEAEARLRALSARLQVARETEARRIARELHDEIGQVLTRLNIDVSRVRSICPPEHLSRGCRGRLAAAVDAALEQIASALDLVRRLSSELRPGVLEQLGLAAALEWQAREIERRTDLTIRVDAEDVEPLDWLISVTLFRVAQEALTNVVRHAEARTVEILLEHDADAIELTVRDDGRGIAAGDAGKPTSLGIVGMQERALLVGGRFAIRGERSEGTTVSVRVPRNPEPREADARLAG